METLTKLQINPEKLMKIEELMSIPAGYVILICKGSGSSIYLESDISPIAVNSKDGVLNDLESGSDILPENYFVETGQEFMVGLINPYRIKDFVTKREFKNFAPKYPQKKLELEKLADGLKEGDNPVLIVVRLKK